MKIVIPAIISIFLLCCSPIIISAFLVSCTPKANLDNTKTSNNTIEWRFGYTQVVKVDSCEYIIVTLPK